jgi:DNA-binding NtrC family response regulator
MFRPPKFPPKREWLIQLDLRKSKGFMKTGSLLIVEDADDIREILIEVLTPLAKTIHEADDGEKGLEMLLKGNYDCVISDINMPNLSGLQMLQEARVSLKAVPFVMITGYGDQKTMREALKLGATDFIDKPFDNAHIRQSVRQGMAYGALLKKVDAKIEEMFGKSNLSPEEIQRFKEMQRGLLRMKALDSVYLKAG